MTRHGADQHYLRADGVYITSVLQPSVGYDPVTDAQAIGAMFVAPNGLAGPQVAYHPNTGYQFTQGRMLGGAADDVVTRIRAWWQSFVTRVKVNAATNRVLNDMRLHPAAAPVVAAAVAAAIPATALAVQGGIAPAPQSPSTGAAAVYTPNAGDPPNLSAGPTAIALAPGQADAPTDLWRRTMAYGGDAPIIFSRSEEAALQQWYGKR